MGKIGIENTLQKTRKSNQGACRKKCHCK